MAVMNFQYIIENRPCCDAVYKLYYIEKLLLHGITLDYYFSHLLYHF